MLSKLLFQAEAGIGWLWAQLSNISLVKPALNHSDHKQMTARSNPMVK